MQTHNCILLIPFEVPVLSAARRWRSSNIAQGHSMNEAAIVGARNRTASLGPSCAFEMGR